MKREFPSPCGDMVLKFDVGQIDEIKDDLFPSPCGDMVLKSSSNFSISTFSESFRPLAGIWF